jgi:hypothetical protein
MFLAGMKVSFLPAGMVITSPVAGLRPWRSAPSVTLNLPKPLSAADAEVRKAKAGPARWLEDAYRDPGKAFTKLEELIKAECWRGAGDKGPGGPRIPRPAARKGRDFCEPVGAGAAELRAVSYALAQLQPNPRRPGGGLCRAQLSRDCHGAG